MQQRVERAAAHAGQIRADLHAFAVELVADEAGLARDFLSGLEVGFAGENHLLLIRDELELVTATGAVGAEQVIGVVAHRGVLAESERAAGRGGNIKGRNGFLINAGDQGAAPFAAGDEDIGSGAARGRTEVLPGSGHRIADVVAAEGTEGAQAFHVERLRCFLLLPLGGREGRGERALEKFQQLRPRRIGLGFTRGLDGFDALGDGHACIVDGGDEHLRRALVAHERGELPCLVGELWVGGELREDRLHVHRGRSGAALVGDEESVERGGSELGFVRQRAEPLHRGVQVLLAPGRIREVADASHDTMHAVGGDGVFIRADEREERLRVRRHARLHRHPDDVRIVEVAFDAGTGNQRLEVRQQLLGSARLLPSRSFFWITAPRERRPTGIWARGNIHRERSTRKLPQRRRHRGAYGWLRIRRQLLKPLQRGLARVSSLSRESRRPDAHLRRFIPRGVIQCLFRKRSAGVQHVQRGQPRVQRRRGLHRTRLRPRQRGEVLHHLPVLRRQLPGQKACRLPPLPHVVAPKQFDQFLFRRLRRVGCRNRSRDDESHEDDKCQAFHS